MREPTNESGDRAGPTTQMRSLEDPGAMAHITEALRMTHLAEGYDVKGMDKAKAGYYMTAADGGQTTFRVEVPTAPYPMMAVEDEDKLRRRNQDIHAYCQANRQLPPDIIREFVEAMDFRRPELENVYNMAWNRLLRFMFPEEEGFFISPQHLNTLDPYFEKVGDTAGKKKVDFVVVYHVKRGNVPILLIELKSFASFEKATNRKEAYEQVKMRHGSYGRIVGISELYTISAFGTFFGIFCGKPPTRLRAVVDDTFWLPHNVDDPNYIMPTTPWAYQVLDKDGTSVLLKLASTIKQMVKKNFIDYEVGYGDAYAIYTENAKSYKNWLDHQAAPSVENPLSTNPLVARLPSDTSAVSSETLSPGSSTPTLLGSSRAQRSCAKETREKISLGAELDRLVPESDDSDPEYKDRRGGRK